MCEQIKYSTQRKYETNGHDWIKNCDNRDGEFLLQACQEIQPSYKNAISVLEDKIQVTKLSLKIASKL